MQESLAGNPVGSAGILYTYMYKNGGETVLMKEGWIYRRGDLYLADLGEADGSKQCGVRPVVLLQNDRANYHAPTVTIAPLTTKIKKKAQQPTHYLLKKASGLAASSMVLAEQMATLDKKHIIRYLGKVSPAQMRGIDEAVKVHLGYYIADQHRTNSNTFR